MTDVERPEPLPTLRLFVALAIPQPTIEQLLATQCLLEETARRHDVNLRLTQAHQFHMTLAFLGDVTIDQVQPIIDATRHATAQYQGCLLTPRTFMVLPSARHARVIAVSCDEATGELSKFVSSLHISLRECGCVIEKRAFHAHITVARLRAPLKLEVAELDLGNNVGPFFAREVAVIQSELKPHGAQYRSLSSTTLRAT